VFKFIKENLEDIELLLYFSDLNGKFPDEVPSYSVKWIAPKESQVPFGDIIVLN